MYRSPALCLFVLSFLCAPVLAQLTGEPVAPLPGETIASGTPGTPGASGASGTPGASGVVPGVSPFARLPTGYRTDPAMASGGAAGAAPDGGADGGQATGMQLPLVGTDATHLPPEVQRELMLSVSQVLGLLTRDTMESFDMMRASAARQGHNIAPPEPLTLEQLAYLESQLGHIGYYTQYLGTMTEASKANEAFRAQQHEARLAELQRVVHNRQVLAATQQAFDLSDQEAWSIIRLPESVEMHGLSGRVSVSVIGSSSSVSVRRVALSFPAGVVLEPPPELASGVEMSESDADMESDAVDATIIDAVARVAERPHVWIFDQGCEESLVLGPGDGCTVVIDWYLPDGRATPTGQLIVDAVGQASGTESILQTHTSLLHAGGRTVEEAERIDQVLIEHGEAILRQGQVLDVVAGQLSAGHFTAPIVDRVTALEELLADGQHLSDIENRLVQVVGALESQSDVILGLSEQVSATDVALKDGFDQVKINVAALDARVAQSEETALEYRESTNDRISSFEAEIAALPAAITLYLREREGFIDIDQIEMVVEDAISRRGGVSGAAAPVEAVLPGLEDPDLSAGALHTRARVLTVADGAATVEYRSVAGALRRMRVSPGDPLREGWIVERVDPIVPSVFIVHPVTGAEAVLYPKDSGRPSPPADTRLAHAFAAPEPPPPGHFHALPGVDSGGGVGLSATRVERPVAP